ncbi:tetratricopeptide repeat protein [Neomegalonema sp.]|uniref:tetratricopeptide repeat protein n=1 Tax=Neomegalonema sp. TaxID=2039713 RepID=UPI0026252D98|nr:tetratricopeptide repeat protein [Neomegalonema sp.]MDD2867315.1 tetratricopeptide repeat protein [Neomegalonema sp.]
MTDRKPPRGRREKPRETLRTPGSAKPRAARTRPRRKRRDPLFWAQIGAACAFVCLASGALFLAAKPRGESPGAALAEDLATGSIPASAPRLSLRASEELLGTHFAAISGGANLQRQMLDALRTEAEGGQDALLKAAVRRAETGDFAALSALAEAAYEAAPEDSPESREAALILGALIFPDGDPERGAALLQEAAEQTEAEVWPWLLLARAQAHLGRGPEALAALTRAEEAARTDSGRLAAVEGRLGLGALAGEPAELRLLAGEALDRAAGMAAQKPADPQAQRGLLLATLRLGDAAARAGEAAEAEAVYERALRLARNLGEAHPAHLPLQRDLGQVQTRLGRMAELRGDLVEARKRHEARVTVARRLAQAAPDSLRERLELAFSLELLADLAVALDYPTVARRQFAEAAGILEDMAGAAPSDSARSLSGLHRKIGNLALAEGDLPEARRRFEAGLDLTRRLNAADPDSPAALGALGAVVKRLGELAVAEGDLSEAGRRFREGVDLDERLARSGPERQDAAVEAVSGLLRLAQIEPDKARGHYLRAREILRPLAAQKRLSPLQERSLAAIERLLAGGPPS